MKVNAGMSVNKCSLCYSLISPTANGDLGRCFVKTILFYTKHQKVIQLCFYYLLRWIDSVGFQHN